MNGRRCLLRVLHRRRPLGLSTVRLLQCCLTCPMAHHGVYRGSPAEGTDDTEGTNGTVLDPSKCSSF